MNIDKGSKKAFIVGGGIASLACAVYLIRDAKMPGENIHILEKDHVLGGALDGSGTADEGYLIRGGRMHEEHFVCTWDLLATIPSLTEPGKSVLDEIVDFNSKVISCSTSRLVRAGKKIDVSSFGLSKHDRYDMLRLFFGSEDSLGNSTIEEWFSEDFFSTVFWSLWSTTFAFQRWSSLVEMRRYFIRFIHLLPGFNQLKGIMRTVYNQYDSVVLPLEFWLKQQGAQFAMNCPVTDVDFDIDGSLKVATAIHYLDDNEQKTIFLSKDDCLFMTLGSMVEDARVGSMTAPVRHDIVSTSDGAWSLWKHISRYHDDFGNPGVFCEHTDKSQWMSFTVTLKSPDFFSFMEEFTGNPAGTGGLVTFTDSSWCMSVVLAHQPHFINQPEGIFVFWGDGLLPDEVGDFVKKKMSDCTGEEILIELFSHLKIMEMMKPAMSDINCIPCLMPYIDSQFLPRSSGDRPLVVPDGAINFAFVGQFVEVADDCVFTVEYSVRTAQTAVYTLLGLKKDILPVYKGSHDIAILLSALKAINR